MAKEEAVFQAQITEGKCNWIDQLLEECDIQTSDDIQDIRKDLMSETIKKMIEAEINQHLGYKKSERFNNDNYCNVEKFFNNSEKKRIWNGKSKLPFQIFLFPLFREARSNTFLKNTLTPRGK